MNWYKIAISSQNVPPILYHGTLSKNVPLIMEKGLIPYENSYLGFPVKAVYLGDYSVATTFSDMGTTFSDMGTTFSDMGTNDKTTILSVDTAQLDKSKLFPDRNVLSDLEDDNFDEDGNNLGKSQNLQIMSWEYLDIIPPSAISIYENL